MGLYVLALVIISLTPLSTIWFHNISGLTLELTEFIKIPLIIISLMPGLAVLLSFQRSMLIAAKKTSPITTATVIEVVGIISVLFLLIKGYFFIGAIAAMTAFIVGRIGAIIYLFPKFMKIVRKFG